MRHVILAVTMFVCAVMPAQAQISAEPPEVFVRDALAAPYGRAMLERLVGAAETGADAACRRDRALDKAALTAGLRDVLERRGARMMAIVEEGVDRAAFAAAFVASAGTDAAAELDRLKAHPDVVRFEEISRPERHARVVTLLFEAFDSFVVVARIKLASLSPVARGERDPLPEDPTAATDAAVEKYIEGSSSVALKRFLELSDMADEARRNTMKPDAADRIAPTELFAGADGELAALCVGKRS